VLRRAYSERWFETFAAPIPQTQIVRDIDGVISWLPGRADARLLEIGCGLGRHASELVRRGYAVVAIDEQPVAVAAARRQTPAAEVLRLDMRQLPTLSGPFDACLILWHAFGYFDAAANERVIADIASLLRPGGRLIIELFNPAWVQAHQHSARREGCVTHQWVDDGRQVVEITYRDGRQDRFSWQLYSPQQLTTLAARHGLSVLATGGWWDFTRPITPDLARFQCILSREHQPDAR